MGVGSDALRRASRDVDTDPQGSEPPAAAPRGTDSVWLILAVSAVIVAGIGFRFFTRSDLWADEVLSVNVARLPLSELRPALRHDGAPPLYYLLLHLWMRVFGTGDISARALSGLFGVAALVPMWFAGRRLDERRAVAGRAPAGARTVAWAATLMLAASPFAIRYATEVRMYSLVVLLVLLGYLAVTRTLERPSWGPLVAVTLITGLLLYTHYWSFALLGVAGLFLLWLARRGPEERRAPARWTLGALVLGALTFLPWLPTFRYQVVHTGTPWAGPVSPAGSAAEAFKSFGGNAHVLGWALLLMVLLAVFARAIDRRHIEVDLWTRPGVRIEAGLAFATLGVGLVLARLSGTTFEGRYASIMFPLFLLAAAFGVTVFASRPVRYGVLALLLVGGFWGGASNALRNRTQAFQVANEIKANGRPGDLVLYCPDSIGTDVSRLLRADVRQVSFPSFAPPGRIDWVDYADRVRATNPAVFAKAVAERAGPGSTIWLVDTTGAPLVDKKCGQIADALTLFRPARVRQIEPNPYFFEHQGLYRYPPR